MRRRDWTEARSGRLNVGDRMEAVQSPIIPVVAELTRRHPGTISLGQGVVYYGPPAETLEKLGDFGQKPQDHLYGPVFGTPALLEAIAHKLESESGVVIGKGRALAVTAGGNMAFSAAVNAIAGLGDQIILQVPYYFNHEMAVRIAGCQAVLVPTDERYQLRPAAIRAAITDRTRAVVTISPNNPTGAVYPEEALREVNDICKSAGIFHIHDEAYEYFTFAGSRHFSPAAISGSEPHTITLYSLSKSYGFASWRIGYMAFPADLTEALQKVQDTLLICPPVVSQVAAVGALSAGSDYCRARIAEIGRARELARDALLQVERSTVVDTEGAIYYLIRLNAELGDMIVVERLIREHGVAVTPGSAFGLKDGCYLRITYGAVDPERVAEGVRRLVGGLRAILGS